MQRFFGFGRRLPQKLGQLLPQPSHLAELEAERARTQAVLQQLEQVKREFEEYRKRALKRQEEAKTAGMLTICKEIIPAIDASSLAFQSVPDELRTHPWQRGMFLASSELAKGLRSLGMIRYGLPSNGSRAFDPRRYAAVATEERVDLPEGAMVRVVRYGYLFRTGEGAQATERLLRPAEVIVSRQPTGQSEPTS